MIETLVFFEDVREGTDVRFDAHGSLVLETVDAVVWRRLTPDQARELAAALVEWAQRGGSCPSCLGIGGMGCACEGGS